MFRPLRDNILVKPIERTKSEHLVVMQQEKPNTGQVIAKGPKALGVNTGDLVRFGTTDEYLIFPEIQINQERFLILSEKDVCFIQE